MRNHKTTRNDASRQVPMPVSVCTEEGRTSDYAPSRETTVAVSRKHNLDGSNESLS